MTQTEIRKVVELLRSGDAEARALAQEKLEALNVEWHGTHAERSASVVNSR